LQGASKQNRDTGHPENPQNTSGAGQIGLRWLTAVIVIPIVLVLVWFGGWVAFAGAVLAMLTSLSELHYMIRHAGHYRPLITVSVCLSLLFPVAAMIPAQRLLMLEIGLSVAVLASFPVLFLRQQLEGTIIDWSLTLAIAIYLGWPVSCLLLLRGNNPATIQFLPVFALYLPRGSWWLLTALLGVWGFDTAAFFSGRYLGRHKLAPHISPGKTWEGVAGGLVLAVLATLLCTVLPLGIPWYLAIVMGLLVGAAAALGDLAESLIKRQFHVKDSGQIMPGHGGMLDRIDSLLFAVIVVFLFAQFLGK
jgi:phosphatidate cytidylyltransferase